MTRLALLLALAACNNPITPPTTIRLETCCLLYPHEDAIRECYFDVLSETDPDGGPCYEIACPRLGYEDAACRLPDGGIEPVPDAR